MTMINFKRSGGMLGRKIDMDFDLNELPDVESRQLMKLLSETNFFMFPQNLIDHVKPDEYEYTITVDAGNTHHTIHTTDATAPDSLRPLLSKLSTLAQDGRSERFDLK
jgi:hypothetical protein